MRFYKIKGKKIIFLVLSIFIGILWQLVYPQPKNKVSDSSLVFKVVRVIDGDTIKINTGELVRYIGVDAPEIHHPKKSVECFGKEAYRKNKELVEGKKVKLEKDVSDKDKYGRLLRYVFLDDPYSSPSSLFINRYLVGEGYAYAVTFPPDVKYADVFIKEQQNAIVNKKGLWSVCKND